MESVSREFAHEYESQNVACQATAVSLESAGVQEQPSPPDTRVPAARSMPTALKNAARPPMRGPPIPQVEYTSNMTCHVSPDESRTNRTVRTHYCCSTVFGLVPVTTTCETVASKFRISNSRCYGTPRNWRVLRSCVGTPRRSAISRWHEHENLLQHHLKHLHRIAVMFTKSLSYTGSIFSWIFDRAIRMIAWPDR